MMRASDASEAESLSQQAKLGPPNELAVLAALSNADVIDVCGAEPIFDLLDVDGDGRLSAEELRQGVRNDAVVTYIWETGNAILKGLLRDRRGIGRALTDIDQDASGPFVSRRGWRRFVQSMAAERVRHLRAVGLVKGRCYWGKGLDDMSTRPSRMKWLCSTYFPRGYVEDFWFYARNNHPALWFLRDPAHPYSRAEAFAAELVLQAYAIWAAGAASREEKAWTSLYNYAWNARMTLTYISVPLLILAELLWVLLACPCARFERRGRKRERVLSCTQTTVEVLGHVLVLPLVVLAVVSLIVEATRLDGSKSDAPVVAWWVCGLLWSYVIWFPLKLVVQFNLCLSEPPLCLKVCKVGRWATERRRAALNALTFGDADDDLGDVEEPWRVFESS